MKKEWIYFLHYRLLALIPAIIAIFLSASSPWTGFFFEIDNDGHLHHGRFYILQFFIDALYGIGIAIIALYRHVKTHLKSVKKECMMIIVFMFPVLIGATLDIIISSMPFIVPSITASLFILFSNISEARINHDALTGMNNRRRTDQYMEDRIASTSPQHPFYFFLGDINSFKKINDTYGHLEGDRALKIVAQALKSIGKLHNVFCSRWAGDEFVIIADADHINHPEGFIKTVQIKLRRLSREAQLPYTIRMSMGYALCHSPETTISALTASADKMLYQAKIQYYESIHQK